MKSILIGLVTIASIYSLAVFVGHFSTIQSFILAILLFVPLDMIFALKRRKFTPFWLWIQPNFPAILVDAGLLETERDWWNLLYPKGVVETGETEVEEGKDADRTALRKGFACYVLSLDRVSNTYAVAWPMSKNYTSGIEHCVQIDLITRGSSTDPNTNFAWHPRLRVKGGRKGYEIALRVGYEWWRERWLNSIQSKPQFEEQWEVLTNSVYLTVAVIPYEEFSFYFSAGSLRSLKRRNAAIAKQDWIEGKCDPESMLLGASIDLSHRYAKIAHRRI
jgi:hypothetical protein